MNIKNNAYCRLCAELKPHNNLKNLQTDEEIRETVVNKLSRLNIMMNFKNTLPNTVCLICIKALEQAFTFVTAVDRAQAFLRDFIQVQVEEVESDLDDKNTFYGPPVENKDVIAIKVEHTEDFMNVDYEDRNVSEGFNDEGKNIVYKNDSGVNISSGDYNVEIKPFVYSPMKANIEEPNINAGCEEYNKQNTNQPSNVLIEDKINVKGENDAYTHLDNNENVFNMVDKINDISKDSKTNLDINVREIKIIHDLKAAEVINTDINEKLQKETISEAIQYSEDYINEQVNRLGAVPINYITMTWADWVWKCSFCETLFSNLEELQTHSMEYHSSCNPYQCTECDHKKLRLNKFLRHVRTHRKFFHYSCYKCFKKFRTINESGQHKLKIHEKSNHICVGCNTTFSTDSELSEHVNKFYQNRWQKKIRAKSQNKNLTCSICKKTCRSISGMRCHLITHTDRKRDHTCEICGKSFFSKQCLIDHMVLHNNDISYPCEICKHPFKTVYQLRSHVSLHSGIKPFTCDNCGKCFRNKINLISHMRSHMDSFPYSCTVCNKKFRLKPYLQNHMLQHTGVKPYACEICSRDFTNLSNRNKHMRSIHGIEMAKRRQTADGVTEEIESLEVEKLNQWKQKVIEHQNSDRPRINKKIGKMKVIIKAKNS